MNCTMTCIQPSPTQAHCSACHRTFGSLGGFDRHRRGGQCLDPGALPMHVDMRGIWRWDGQDPHADARSALTGQAQGCETGSGVPRDTSGDSEPLETLAGPPEVWSAAVAPGGYVCAVPDSTRPDGICGMPVEDEPCSLHAARNRKATT